MELSTKKLIEIAYYEKDENKYWNLIFDIHKRGTLLEFNLAKEMSISTDSVRREIAADILGQLGHTIRSFQDESVEILIRLLSDGVEDVIVSAAFALGHRRDIASVPELIGLATHVNPRIRQAVTTGLSGIENEDAINALVHLSGDRDIDVRNWATFGLGSLCKLDTEYVRNALWLRVSDDVPEIRGEALIGLAERGDKNATQSIIDELNGEFFGSWAINAARILANPIFISTLENLQLELVDEDEYFHSEIDDAIASCSEKVTIH